MKYIFTIGLSFLFYVCIGYPLPNTFVAIDTLSKDSSRFHMQIDDLSQIPAASLQQYIKGKDASLFIQEASGEPGSLQNMFFRGVANAFITPMDIYQVQPIVILDGIPLVGEHPFAYDIQESDVNRIGAATNLLSMIDLNNIASIEVIKDPAQLALYGPAATNGAIVMTTKMPAIKRIVDINFYSGIAFKPNVETINASFENSFRKQFYDRYTTNGRYSEDENYPVYLSDSLNNSFYGSSNWTDSYYKSKLEEGLTASISTGSDRARYRFSLGNLIQNGVADNTSLKRYNTMFHLQMKPLKWLSFMAMFNGTRIERERNKSLRDRFVEMNYIPDLSSPLSPNNDNYSKYLNLFNNGFDDNVTSLIQGEASLLFNFGRLKLDSRFLADYNEGTRDLFYPKDLLEQNSYASNYYGLNQRLIFNNTLKYNWSIDDDNHLDFIGGNALQWDTYRYNYLKAFKGTNDFIQIISGTSAFPEQLTYKYADETKHNLVSFFGNVEYTYKDLLDFSLTLRTDGSSNAQPVSRWLFQPAWSLNWNIKQQFLSENKKINELKFNMGMGKIGQMNAYDYYSQGPLYVTQIGYEGNSTIPSYNGTSALVRPYNLGWIGYNMGWAYTDHIDAGIMLAAFDQRLTTNFSVYVKDNKNQIIGIPEYNEYGYKQSLKNGMDISNRGAELFLSYQLLKPLNSNRLSWNIGLNMNYNVNKLKALPDGIDELKISDYRKLKVGESIDNFWLYQNDGQYTEQDQIPDGMNFNGIELNAGDPIWKDINQDNKVNRDDKKLLGNIFPKSIGTLTNRFTLGSWSLSTELYFNLGRKILNGVIADRFDFVNHEGTSSLASVKEITFWEKTGDYDKYPIYNPWSSVIAYRTDQDLFLENGDFLKLRTLNVGYDFKSLLDRKSSFKRLYAYLSASNLFTISSYSGRDPELVSYTGIDDGYGMVIPKTFVLGLKVEL